jgi:PhnB protein
MVSDEAPDRPVAAEGDVQIALDFTEPAEMARAFQAPASVGKVTLPIQDTFWHAKFGMLTHLHGVRWMFNCELKKT